MTHTIKKLPIRVHKNQVVRSQWTSNDGFTISEIRDKYNNLAKELYDSGHRGEMGLMVLFPAENGGNGKWRYLMKFHKITDDLTFDTDTGFDDYWGIHRDAETPDTFNAFSIFVTKKNGPKGGYGKYNDCFYDCLDELIPTTLKKVFPKPADLKKFCGIKRTDLIPLDKISMIENKLPGCSINITGEYNYISTRNTINKINLRLYNEHFNIAKKKELNFAKGITKDEKQPVIYEYLPNDPSNVRCCDGKKFATVKYTQLCKMKSNPRSCPYMLIKSDGSNMKEQHILFMSNAMIIKEKTDGKYNLLKTGKVTTAALNRFYELNKTVVADPIEHDETEWLSDCNMGSLIWAKKGYKGEGWSYDINSAFSTILANHKFSFPVKHGKFKKITQKDFENMKFIEYGIYRVKIYDADYRLLPTKKQKYTHFDVTRAKELGYKVKVIEDDQPNLLSYAGPNMRLPGTAFKDYVDELYALKKALGKEFPIFKKLLNVIWGVLCEKRIRKKFIKNDEEYDVPHDEEVCSIVPVSNTHFIVKTAITSNSYKTNFARLGPFLLSRCRCMVSRIVEPHLKNIVRVHTDGFISKKELTFEKHGQKIDSVKIGTGLGDLKLEKQSNNIHIHHVNKVVWNNVN